MEVHDREALIKRIQDSFSSLVQVSGVKGCLAENPAEELELLNRLYLKKRIAVAERSRSGIGGNTTGVETSGRSWEDILSLAKCSTSLNERAFGGS